MTLQAAIEDVERLVANVEKVILGKRDAVKLVVTALLARGHVLLEDRPGLGKTLLSRALAISIACSFRRIQCTPDLLPVDITGYVDPRDAKFKAGPIFASIVLADELNRAMPRTQSALLEAMAERQVSIEGTTHALPAPFMLVATQNPIEYVGVNDLPEAQLDRFHLVVSPGYPREDDERRLLLARRDNAPGLEELKPVLASERIVQLCDAAAAVRMEDALVEYVLAIVRRTRDAKELSLGASPRAAQHLIDLSRAFALCNKRTYVVPDDVKALAVRCLAHRVTPRVPPEDGTGQREWREDIVRGIVDRVPPPGT